MDDSVKEKVLEQLDRERLIEIAKRLAEIVSITGEEKEVAEYLGGEFARLGMEVKYQEVEEGRPNVIGTLKGSGGGATLMFCAHMDHFDNPQKTEVEGDRIYGRGLVNMKAAFPCYIVAVEMLKKASVALKGDIIISGVVGEIEKAPVGGFAGKQYRGAGVGARYLMDHGVTADMCIIGEPTGLHLQIGNAGLVWAQVRVEGRAENFVIKAGRVAEGAPPHPLQVAAHGDLDVDGGAARHLRRQRHHAELDEMAALPGAFDLHQLYIGGADIQRDRLYFFGKEHIHSGTPVQPAFLPLMIFSICFRLLSLYTLQPRQSRSTARRSPSLSHRKSVAREMSNRSQISWVLYFFGFFRVTMASSLDRVVVIVIISILSITPCKPWLYLNHKPGGMSRCFWVFFFL